MTGLREVSESDDFTWSATDQSGLEKLPFFNAFQATEGSRLMRAVEGATWVSDSSAEWSPAARINDLRLFRDLLNCRPDVSASIGDFPGEPYRTLRPIPITLEWTGDEYLARFDEANIAMTGKTQSEALGNLAADILDTYELYLGEEANLGPAPAQQVAVLRRYIARR